MITNTLLQEATRFEKAAAELRHAAQVILTLADGPSHKPAPTKVIGDVRRRSSPEDLKAILSAGAKRTNEVIAALGVSRGTLYKWGAKLKGEIKHGHGHWQLKASKN